MVFYFIYNMHISKKIALLVIPLLIGAAFFIGIFYYVGWGPLAKAAEALSLAKLAWVAFLFFLVFYLSIVRWKVILDSKYNMKTSFKNVFIANILDFTVSYVTPTVYLGGEPVRAFFISQKADISFSDAFSSVVIDKLIDLSGHIIFLIVGLMALVYRFALPEKMEYAFILFIAFLVAAIYFLYHRVNNKKRVLSRLVEKLRLDKVAAIQKIKEKIIEIEHSIFDFFHNYPAAFKKAMWITLVMRLLLIVEFWFLMRFLGASAGIVTVLAITALTIFAYLLPIPGSLGSFEAVLTFSFTLMGFTAEQGLMFGLIVRGLYFVALVVGFSLFFHYFSGDVLKKIMEGEKEALVPDKFKK